MDLHQELAFIHCFDQAFQAICRIIDMPDRRARLFAQLELQNNNKHSAREAYQFKEFEDRKIGAMKAALHVAIAFTRSGNSAKNQGSCRIKAMINPIHGDAGIPGRKAQS